MANFMVESGIVEEKSDGNSNFGGCVVPQLLFCDHIENVRHVKCVEKQGEVAIIHLHNFGIVGQFVSQIAIWNFKKG